MPSRKRIRVVLLAALAWAAVAAARAAAPVPAVRPMYFEHLTTRDGLSQSTINGMLQDSQGYLWLATENGLDRYDGDSIREYRRERGNEHGLASDYIWAMAEDAKGDLWLATDGGGVARWDRRTEQFQLFRHDAQKPRTLASDAVRTLLIDTQGRVWAGTLDQGLDVLDPKTGDVRHFRHREGDPRSLAADAVCALFADRRGRIWIGTDGGLSRYEPAGDDFQNYPTAAGGDSLSDVRVRAIREDHTGALWIGTYRGGLNRLDPDTGRVTNFRHDPKDPGSLSHDRVLAVLEDDAQRLWVATADGLNLFERESATFVRYGRDADNPQSLRDSDVMSLYQDRGGVLWVGTRGGGASHWNPRSWLFGHYRSGAFRDTQVNSFAADGNGKVWVGTVGAGLVEIDTRNRRERHYGANAEGGARLTDDRIMSLLYDRRGVLWIGTMTGGLNRLDVNSGALQMYRNAADDPASLPANGVMSLYEDRLGTLWVGTYGGGLASIDQGSGKVTRYPYGQVSPTSLSGSRASAIVEDAIGNLWVGTEGGGLNLLDRRTGRFYTFRRDDRDAASLSDNSVYALHLDHHGQLWVGTAGGGLDRVIGTSAQPAAVRFENQSGPGGIAAQVVYGIESDREDRLWLSTNTGLARLDTNARSIKWFHQVHGLQDEEFNFNAHYQDPEGTLFFGGNNGFNAFSPDLIAPTAPPPRVVLTTAAKLNRPIAPQELPNANRPLALAYDDKLVTLDFAALDFTSPAHNHYSYQLEGFDSGWIDAGSLHRATYTNLDAGDYVFKVRAANADGVWSGKELAVPVHVAPAPWKTPAARMAYLVLGLLVFGYLWRLQRLRRDRELRYSRELEQTVQARTRELEERNLELQVLSRAKSDFVARMSHELRTPMNGVLGMTSLLLDTRIDPAQRRFAEAIHRSADSLLTIVDDILDFSKIEAGRLQLDPVKCDLTELVEQTVEMLAARAATKGIELLFDSPTVPLPRVRLDAVRLRQVLVNLGGNAVKFTERGEVTLRLIALGMHDERLSVRFEVADTGVGIAPENQSRIFEEFAQEDASTTRRFGGTGLGLAISRQIVELLGGQLTLVSAPGEGSTFSFELTLPLADAAAQPPARRSSLEGVRALVVLDNAAARALIAKPLRDWGARTTEVPSLAEAVAASAAGQYDAVIIDDWLLNEADGLWQALRSGQAPNLRTVRLLSFVSLTSDTAVTSDPFDAELTKPLRLGELHRILSDGAEEEAQPFTATNVFLPVTSLTQLAGRVLVVEDQPLNREVATGILASLGLLVDTANHGGQALDMLRTRHFDAVLMDCEMPVMDGFSATSAIRHAESAGTRIPIIALTADATAAGREACLAAGMDDYLAKPFRREALHATLTRWLGRGRGGAGAAPAAKAARGVPEPAPASEPILDGATLDALRALPRNGARDMLCHIGEMYLRDSRGLVTSIEAALSAGNSGDLARAAHAWRSYNGNVGAHGLARLCRELEDAARQGDFAAARETYARISTLHLRVRDELQYAMRKSA
jgi:signal transduction histidine kinase/ligand-binding sensor domain-containing protein/DNA-binding response OmpR family regulator/HPt (histidine-containing phosphotransfer) domain-containing protein